jgi:hypothetical protein
MTGLRELQLLFDAAPNVGFPPEPDIQMAEEDS